MAEHVKSYRYNDLNIEVLPYFLYEVSFYKISENMANMLEKRYYKSDKLLNVKETTIKKYKHYTLIRYINLLGAPIEFIEDNYLPEYELIKKKKK